MISKTKKGKIELFFPKYDDNPHMGEWIEYENYNKN
jgi:hypothetical protein